MLEFYSDMLLTSDIFPSMVLPLREAAGRNAQLVDRGRSTVSDEKVSRGRKGPIWVNFNLSLT